MSSENETSSKARVSPAMQDSSPVHWKEAISSLVSSRLAIFKLEASEAAARAINKIVLLSITLICTFFAWIIIVAALIGALSEKLSWPWYQTAFAIAGIHLFVALIPLLLIRSESHLESFTLTKEEFEKDKKWLDQLKADSK